jgi:hypothetical protein
MLLLNTLKISLIALLASVPAHADVRHAEAYESLVGVSMQPNHAPRTLNGVAELSASESRHHEKLPLQLNGAVQKIQKTKYQPGALSRDNPTEF